MKSSARDSVQMDAEAAATAQKKVHTALHKAECCHLSTSSEVIVDSDSVYSVCCSDVTSDAPNVVYIDHETAPIPGRST